MLMAFPIFFMFAAHAVKNSYLSLFFSQLGFDVAQVGLLLAVFELSGTILPLLLGRFVEHRRNYGIPLVVYGLLCFAASFPMLLFHNFVISAVSVVFFAAGIKAMVPLSDTVTENILVHKGDYGKVRTSGSVGFVLMQFVLQAFCRPSNLSGMEMVLWLGSPFLLYAASLALVPGLLSGKSGVPAQAVVQKNQKAVRFSLKEELHGLSAEFWMAMVMITFAFLGSCSYNSFLSLYIAESLHLDVAALMWGISSCAEIPFMFFSGYLIKKFTSRHLLYVSIFAMSVRMVVYVAFPSFGGLVAGQLLHAFTYGVFHPAAVAFVCERVSEHKKVTGMTMYAILAQGVAYLIGNAAGGIIIAQFGYQFLFLGSALLPILGIVIFRVWKLSFGRNCCIEAQ
ncbi:MAG: MFS transporter [Treponema sp.]|nr:MFS transporter [Treponema sp.]